MTKLEAIKLALKHIDNGDSHFDFMSKYGTTAITKVAWAAAVLQYAFVVDFVGCMSLPTVDANYISSKQLRATPINDMRTITNVEMAAFAYARSKYLSSKRGRILVLPLPLQEIFARKRKPWGPPEVFKWFESLKRKNQ